MKFGLATPGGDASASTVKRVSLPLIGIGLGLVIWEWLNISGRAPAYALPSIEVVLLTAWEQRGLFLEASLVTLREVLAGIFLAIVIGSILGFAIASFRAVEKGLFPLLIVAQVIPKIAFAPLLIVWFGYGTSSKVLLAFLLSFFPITLDTLLGFRSASIQSGYLTKAMGANRWRTFYYVRLPAAFPFMFAGIKLASGLALTGAVVAEVLGSDEGLGHLINSYGTGQDSPVLFASILYVAAMGWLLFGLVRLAERRAIFWHISQRGQS